MAADVEFPHRISLAEIGSSPRDVTLAANAEQCLALARRFDLAGLAGLEAEARIVRKAAGIEADGRVRATVTQRCVVTGQPVERQVDEPFRILFTPPASTPLPDEIEIASDDCDQMEHDGLAIDLGEAVAQTLALALDPFPRAAEADAALASAGVLKEGEEATGPFAALKALKPQSP